MSYLRRYFLILLVVAISGSPRLGHAAQIRTYDLDSLCFMSTDVVEATLIRHHIRGQAEWKDTLAATVTDSIAGQFHPGDKIGSLDLELYDPAVTGQRCFLFLERREYNLHYLQPSPVISPRLADMLLIDSRGHVRRYYQDGNPGGLVAEGFSSHYITIMTKSAKHGVVTYFPDGPLKISPETENDVDEQRYPTVAEERAAIISKWAVINAIRPRLAHEPRPEDIPFLLGLLHERWRLHEQRSDFPNPDYRLTDGLATAICSRLADLSDPAVALDAMTADPDDDADFLSGLTDTPFGTDKSLDYARSVLADPRETVERRIAAAKVLEEADPNEDIGKRTKHSDRATATAIGLADATPEPLRLVLIPNLDLKQRATADALRQSYHRTHSQELQFAIENAFYSLPGDSTDAGYFSLKPASGPVLSIVRPSSDLPVKSAFVGLVSEIIRTRAIEGAALSRKYVFTNLVTGRVFRVDLGGSDTFGDYEVKEQVPLPKTLPRGRYQIALEFCKNNRLISTGHSVTLLLPPEKP